MDNNKEQLLAEAQRYFENNDYFRSLSILQDLAESQFPPGIVALASWYLHGRVVDQDKSKAFSLYSRAAALGNIEAIYELAVCYEQGDGCEQDLARAARLYEEAARNGDVDAVTELARMKYYGIGCKMDRSSAEKLYLIAAQLGDKESAELVQCLGLSGDLEDQSRPIDGDTNPNS